MAESLLQTGLHAVGILASDFALASSILKSTAKTSPKSETQDVVVCFDTKPFGPEAVQFVVDAFTSQTQLVVTKQEIQEEKQANRQVVAIGATREVLQAIKEKKAKMTHFLQFEQDQLQQNVLHNHEDKEFTSGERIDLIMYELNQVVVMATSSEEMDATLKHIEDQVTPTANDKLSSSAEPATPTLETQPTDAPSSTEAVTSSPIPTPFHMNDLLLPQAIHKKIISEMFPLHEESEKQFLLDKWVKQRFGKRPLHKIRDYFGDEVGFYFAFLNMFTRWLVVPSVLGVLVVLIESTTTSAGVYAKALYSLFVTSWATAFLKFWKRRESVLRKNWGIQTADALMEVEHERIGFFGEKRFDPVEERYYTHFSSMHRMKRYIVTSLVILVMLLAMFGFAVVYFRIDSWVAKVFVDEEGMYAYVTLMPTVLYSVVVLALDDKYTNLAESLTKYENHRTDTDFSSALVLKLACFYFINNFSFLFYQAFWLRDSDQLQTTLSSLLITRQLIGNVKENLVPLAMAKTSVHMQSGKIARANSSGGKQLSSKELSKEKIVLSKIEAELLFPTYDGTFDDYLELFVQFGQITLFASAYPLAALCCLLNNVIEIRSDGFKLFVSYRRTTRTLSKGIGAWSPAFDALGYLSVVTNCAILGLHAGLLDRMFPTFSFGGLLALVVGMEHVMLGMKICIEALVPDVPTSVLEKDRMERAALRKKARLQLEIAQRVGRQRHQSTRETHDHQVVHRELEEEVKRLSELYLKWIQDERTKRRELEVKLEEVLQHNHTGENGKLQ